MDTTGVNGTSDSNASLSDSINDDNDDNNNNGEEIPFIIVTSHCIGIYCIEFKDVSGYVPCLIMLCKKRGRGRLKIFSVILDVNSILMVSPFYTHRVLLEKYTDHVMVEPEFNNNNNKNSSDIYEERHLLCHFESDCCYKVTGMINVKDRLCEDRTSMQSIKRIIRSTFFIFMNSDMTRRDDMSLICNEYKEILSSIGGNQHVPLLWVSLAENHYNLLVKLLYNLHCYSEGKNLYKSYWEGWYKDLMEDKYNINDSIEKLFPKRIIRSRTTTTNEALCKVRSKFGNMRSLYDIFISWYNPVKYYFIYAINDIHLRYNIRMLLYSSTSFYVIPKYVLDIPLCQIKDNYHSGLDKFHGNSPLTMCLLSEAELIKMAKFTNVLLKVHKKDCINTIESYGIPKASDMDILKWRKQATNNPNYRSRSSSSVNDKVFKYTIMGIYETIFESDNGKMDVLNTFKSALVQNVIYDIKKLCYDISKWGKNTLMKVTLKNIILSTNFIEFLPSDIRMYFTANTINDTNLLKILCCCKDNTIIMEYIIIVMEEMRKLNGFKITKYGNSIIVKYTDIFYDATIIAMENDSALLPPSPPVISTLYEPILFYVVHTEELELETKIDKIIDKGGLFKHNNYEIIEYENKTNDDNINRTNEQEYIDYLVKHCLNIIEEVPTYEKKIAKMIPSFKFVIMNINDLSNNVDLNIINSILTDRFYSTSVIVKSSNKLRITIIEKFFKDQQQQQDSIDDDDDDDDGVMFKDKEMDSKFCYTLRDCDKIPKSRLETIIIDCSHIYGIREMYNIFDFIISKMSTDKLNKDRLIKQIVFIGSIHILPTNGYGQPFVDILNNIEPNRIQTLLFNRNRKQEYNNIFCTMLNQWTVFNIKFMRKNAASLMSTKVPLNRKFLIEIDMKKDIMLSKKISNYIDIFKKICKLEERKISSIQQQQHIKIYRLYRYFLPKRKRSDYDNDKEYNNRSISVIPLNLSDLLQYTTKSLRNHEHQLYFYMINLSVLVKCTNNELNILFSQIQRPLMVIKDDKSNDINAKNLKECINHSFTSKRRSIIRDTYMWNKNKLV